LKQRSPSELRDRLVAPCYWPPDGAPVTSLDVAAFVRRLLLFDHYVLQSNGLKELEKLVAVFGVSGTLAILESGAVSIQLEPVTIGQTGQTDLQIRRERGGLLPLCSLGLASLTIANPQEHIEKAIHNATAALQFSSRERSQLRKAIRARIRRVSMQIGPKTLEQTQADLLQHHGLIERAVARVVSEKLVLKIVPDELMLRVEHLGGNDYQFATNMEKLFGFNMSVQHRVLEQALLAVAGLNKRFAEMESSQSLALFSTQDDWLVDGKIKYLLELVGARQNEGQFIRALAIAGLPEVPDGVPIDASRLLAIRASDECRSFRKWLRAAAQASDQEIADAYHPYRDRVAELARGWPVRTARFIATTGLGAVPAVGPLIGGVAGAIDTFLVDRLLPSPGPLAFLASRYPSLLAARQN
jgi:hypothetical protein